VAKIGLGIVALGLLLGPMLSAADADAESGRQADPQGTTFALPGGVRVVLTPRTQATIAPKTQLLALWPGKRVPTHSVFVRSGRVDVEIPEASVGQSAVVVAAPDETRVLVRSGKSSVRLGSGRLYAACESGLTSVSEGMRFRSVPVGKVREVSRTTASEYDLLPDPPIRAPALQLVTRGRASLAGYGWGPVPGATAYEAEIRDTTSGQRVLRLVTPAPGFATDSPGLLPGQYELSVRAVDRFGMAGRAGAARPIRVVGVELPDGATVEREARIELDQGQSIRFTHAEGLSVAVAGGSTRLGPADPIPLMRDQATPVYLRGSAEASPHVVTLVPRKASLAAEVTPKDAVWPVDQLTLAVRRTRSGQAGVDLAAPPPARVLLGVQPIEVEWHRSGDGWRARLGQQPGRGPWVVRLEVLNQHGAVVARDSAEVVRLPGSRVLRPAQKTAP
jgi:hypothetical protein